MTLQDKAAHTAIYRGAETTTTFGDVRGEFKALLEGVAFYDMPWQAKLILTGDDRVRWLNGMVTNNVRDLPLGQGVYSFLLTAQGRIQADLMSYNRGDHLLVTTDREQLATVSSTFDHYIIMDDVEVADISDKLSSVGVAGTRAAQTLSALGILPSGLEPGGVVDTTWGGIGISIARSAVPHMDGYEIWLAPQNLGRLRDALIAAGAAPVGSEALELFRIARGVPRYGVDLGLRALPQETEQRHALNFSKGCYIGQEIVERIHSRAIVHRTFVGFELAQDAGVDGESSVPSTGLKVRFDDKDVGEITSAARIPFPEGDRILALGYLRREAAAPGTKVEIAGQPATVRTLPFSE